MFLCKSQFFSPRIKTLFAMISQKANERKITWMQLRILHIEIELWENKEVTFIRKSLHHSQKLKKSVLKFLGKFMNV